MAGISYKAIPSSLVIASITGMVFSMEVHIISDSIVSRFKGLF
jgi:uncharacterized metal-binding protein